LSPRNFNNLLIADKEKRQEEYEMELKIGRWTAWHIAAYVGSSFGGEKLPDLNDLMNKPIFDSTKKEDIPKKILTKEEKWNQQKAFVQAMMSGGLAVRQEVKDKYNL
jgi:hypothetical protein